VWTTRPVTIILALAAISGTLQATPQSNASSSTTAVGAKPPASKYGVKSGIVEFQNVVPFGKSKVDTKTIVYFDDFGAKERKDSYMSDQLTKSSLNDGKNLYALAPDRKEAWLADPVTSGLDLPFDSPAFTRYHPTALPDRVIAGKSCQFVTFTVGKTKHIVGGYKGIVFFHDWPGAILAKAVKFEENAVIPPGTFEVPVGYTVHKSQ
jgi:hypothetical protein